MIDVMATILRIRNLKNIRRTHIAKPALKCPQCFGACACAICIDIRDGVIDQLERKLLDHAENDIATALARSYAKDWP